MTDAKQVAEKDAVAAKQGFRAMVLKSPLTWVLVALAAGFVAGHAL